MPVPVQFQIVIFAVIAAFVLFQLYNVLGKRVGRQPEEDARAQGPAFVEVQHALLIATLAQRPRGGSLTP